MFAQKLDHRLSRRLRMEILMSLGRQQDRSPSIDKMADFHHMLFFALPIGVGTHTTDILEIDLHARPSGAWSGSGLGLLGGGASHKPKRLSNFQTVRVERGRR